MQNVAEEKTENIMKELSFLNTPHIDDSIDEGQEISEMLRDFHNDFEETQNKSKEMKSNINDPGEVSRAFAGGETMDIDDGMSWV